jgi:hypothetical protein
VAIHITNNNLIVKQYINYFNNFSGYTFRLIYNINLLFLLVTCFRGWKIRYIIRLVICPNWQAPINSADELFLLVNGSSGNEKQGMAMRLEEEGGSVAALLRNQHHLLRVVIKHFLQE